MPPDAIAGFAIVILILPMAYFLLASPSFLFVKLDIPPVAKLLRGMFHGYFVALAIAGVIATAGLAVAGRPGFIIIGIGVLAFAVLAHRWFLRRMDARIDSDNGGKASGLRRLHLAGMMCNAIQFAAVASCIPYIMAAPS